MKKQFRPHTAPAFTNFESRIDGICKGITAWLENEGGRLEASVDRTISDRLFSLHDVSYMIDQIALTVTHDALTSWVNENLKSIEAPQESVSDLAKSGMNVLCLHAGNLPMVGLQDIIATLLSGTRYHGKLSKKDPWLLEGLLLLLQKHLPENVIMWSTDLDDFNGYKMDRILFAGSEASVVPVKNRLKKLGVTISADDTATRFLIRTARFSIALLSEKEIDFSGKSSFDAATSGVYDFETESPGFLNALAEAILRYEGRGCRSIAVIVAPCKLSAVADILVPVLQAYTKKYPALHGIKPGRTYWTSYLKATERDYHECGPVLLTEDTDLLGKEDVICWIPGDLTTVQQLSGQLGSKVQNIYMDDGPANLCTEPLSKAQIPSIDWQPDGVDILNWLLT